MTVSGGALALAGVLLFVNMNLQFPSSVATLEVPQPPIVYPLQVGLAEVDWNDVTGAVQYELQVWRPSGWIALPDNDLGVDIEYYGSRAVVSKRSGGALINTFRVRALGCGRVSDWSAHGQKASAEMVTQPVNAQELSDLQLQDLPSNIIWSGRLTAGTTSRTSGDLGYSHNGGVGLLSTAGFSPGQDQYRILHALQGRGGFVLELQHTRAAPPEFAVEVHNEGETKVTRLSSCDSVRLKTDEGSRYVWLGADVGWQGGSHSALRISVPNGFTVPRDQQALRTVRTLTASFERMPTHHVGDEFSFLLRFSEPVTVNADSLLDNSLRIRAGTVTAVQPVDGRRDLWEVMIAPDARRSVHLRLIGGRNCAAPGAICSQHQIRLANEPEAVIIGPPISVSFASEPGSHSGAHQVPVLIKLSEPMLTNSQMLKRLALNASGGSLIDVRRVEGRSDLWELIVAPESAVAVDIKLSLIGECGARTSCLDDIYRIANPLNLSIPPAVVHLTFDDGPHPLYTPQILDILAWHGARATFFVTGESATLYPELIERIVSEGHTVANHTWNHVALDTLSAEEFEETVLRTQRALGEHATSCIRPPYYRADSETYARAAQLGLEVIMGNVRPLDWTRPGAMVIANRIVAGAAPNAVVVLHDGGGDRSQTVEGLRMALAHLRAQNYSFQPVCS